MLGLCGIGTAVIYLLEALLHYYKAIGKYKEISLTVQIHIHMLNI